MTKGMGKLGRDALIRESLPILAEDPNASMADVAAGLGVGRTTLYRHFGDRETMIAEAAHLGARMFGDAFLSARPEAGLGLDAVERVCTQLFTVPDVLTLLFADNPIITDDTFAEVDRRRRAESAAAAADGEAGSAAAAAGGDAQDAVGSAGGEAGSAAEPPGEEAGRLAGAADSDQLEAVIARGQADGSITDDVPVEWAAMFVFLTVGSGHLYSLSAGGANPESRARALELTLRAVRAALAAGPR